MKKNNENESRRFAKSVKKSLRKLKYLDRTQASYFVITTFIASFCMFTGLTYSYFTFTKNMNAATITIAKLHYTLESQTEGYKNKSIKVPAGETKIVDLELKSLNGARTRYALNYTTDTQGVNVYYSESLRKNTSGIIGAKGSLINMRVVLENKSLDDATVSFGINGGYLQNNLSSNITEGYFEEDLTIRTVVYDEYFENPTLIATFPDKANYSFYKAECSNGVEASFDLENWELKRSDESKQTSCDVYFKKATEDIELYYNINGKNESNSLTKEKPDTNGLYKFQYTKCTNVGEYTFDESTYEFKVVSYNSKALCIATFETDHELINSDRFTVTFEALGGKVNKDSKIVFANGKYGYLPKPTREGSLFLGWFTEEEDGVEITSESTVELTADTKLYAHYQETNQLDVTLLTLNKNAESLPNTVDDYGTTYYYPSDSVDNYVRFANYNFRILRINSDGSIKIMYDGKKLHANGDESRDRVAVENVAWDTDNKTGYMYSKDENEPTLNNKNSNIKNVLEDWYKKNISKTTYANYVQDKIFCNDRSTTLNLGYGAYERLVLPDVLHIPQITCPDINDAFTVRDSNIGNASLDYPVGLISADEIALIGKDGYLERGIPFWTMSPANENYMLSSTLEEVEPSSELALVPVLNVSAEYAASLEGTGTIDDPFMVKY